VKRRKPMFVGSIDNPSDIAVVDQWQAEVQGILERCPTKAIKAILAEANKTIQTNLERGDDANFEQVTMAYLAVFGWNSVVINCRERKKLEAEFREDGK
jgi:hypothetical protein